MKDLDRFATIAWVVRHRGPLPWIAGVLPVVAGVVLASARGNVAWGVVGVLSGVLLFACVRLAVEVIDLVAETLLPR